MPRRMYWYRKRDDLERWHGLNRTIMNLLPRNYRYMITWKAFDEVARRDSEELSEGVSDIGWESGNMGEDWYAVVPNRTAMLTVLDSLRERGLIDQQMLGSRNVLDNHVWVDLESETGEESSWTSARQFLRNFRDSALVRQLERELV